MYWLNALVETVLTVCQQEFVIVTRLLFIYSWGFHSCAPCCSSHSESMLGCSCVHGSHWGGNWTGVWWFHQSTVLLLTEANSILFSWLPVRHQCSNRHSHWKAWCEMVFLWGMVRLNVSFPGNLLTWVVYLEIWLTSSKNRNVFLVSFGRHHSIQWCYKATACFDMASGRPTTRRILPDCGRYAACHLFKLWLQSPLLLKKLHAPTQWWTNLVTNSYPVSNETKCVLLVTPCHLHYKCHLFSSYLEMAFHINNATAFIVSPP